MTSSWDVPGYKVVEFLGNGAFGEVRSGYDKQTNRKVSNIFDRIYSCTKV